MPPSLGSQWQLLRHYLKQNGNPEHWENVLRRLEKAVTWRIAAKTNLERARNLSGTKQKDGSKGVQPATVLAMAAEGEKPKSDDKPSDTVNMKRSPSTPKMDPVLTKEDLGLKPDLADQEPGVQKPNGKEESLSGVQKVGSIIDGLRLRRDLALGRLFEQKQGDFTTKTSVHGRTAFLITSLVTAESKDSILNRTKLLITHLMKHPEARDYAIKEGGVRALLRIENQLDTADPKDKEVSRHVQEALIVLGYINPCRGPGPSILSIDGGGIRGLIAIEILKQLERLSGRKVTDLFDYIVGVSTGAIIAAVIGSGVGNLDDASDMYHTLSKQMFGNTSVIGGASRLVLRHSYYDTTAWEQILKERLGDITMTCVPDPAKPKLCLVSCVVNRGRLSPFLFRSYSLPYRVRSCFPGTGAALVWQAVRASAAAPTYFEEFHHHGLVLQDGGIMVNNPCGIAVHEARLLYGAEAMQRGCVVSLGTGRVLHRLGANLDAGSNPAQTSWKDKFNKILDSATDTEGVHQVLGDLLPDGHYFRINPPLNEECAMDEINSEKLNCLLMDTRAYMLRNRAKLQQVSRMLTRRRPLGMRLADSVRRRAHLMGLQTHY